MSETGIRVRLDEDGVWIDAALVRLDTPLTSLTPILGLPTRTLDAGSQPAPYGHRNNQVHIFDDRGIYLTEHHASRMIGSLNFVFLRDKAIFRPDNAFHGTVEMPRLSLAETTTEHLLAHAGFRADLPGSFSTVIGPCWVGVDTCVPHRGSRRAVLSVVEVNVCGNRRHHEN